ncbi:MAG: hypothetical protein HZA78_11740 [Candidatus Schekmanbacteria bacterium]|nr:hypothetical protein [Candidatus Schekmanbacteria bacterium]
MGCEEFRQNLELITSLDDDNEYFKPTIEHLKVCSRCADDFLAIHNFDEALRGGMADVSVPPYLGSRIKAQIRQVSALPQPVKIQWAYALAGFLFITGLIFYNQVKILTRLEQINATLAAPVSANYVGAAKLAPSHNAILQLIAAHALKRHRNVIGSKFVVFEDPQINQTFQNKFSFKVIPPKLTDDLKLVGGNKCHSCNYEMAYLLYRQGPESISLCVFPASQFGLSDWQGAPQTFPKNEHKVTVWKNQDNIYVMIFRLSEKKLSTLAFEAIAGK